ncbi:MAG: bifunctional metallophosphatase/5'-nucleotidase [Cryomorphaceae bacterium]|nr:MAG: bifunctional metallophosphatase/5'-nucleotidase [Cryomorphaceae bacterium]|tara:strand:- start:350 stop:1261 length:912 start_codon:yes stop_codon:yes gene_type:complete
MKRRYFLEKITSSTIFGLSIPFLSFDNINFHSKKITILHTNDVHSHIDPFPPNDPLNPNGGGVIARAKIINKFRKENPNTLMFDAGDIFQGTPYFNFFGGEIELKLMSKLGYNASTLGNHEFDNGIKKLSESLKYANFSFINSNYNLKNTPLENKVKKYEIYNIDEIKVGVFGLGIALNGLVEKNLYNGLEYLDPIEITNDITYELKKDHKCDIVICLSHLGFKYDQRKEEMCDLILAKKTKNIDLIIGGHTHTFMKKPVEVTNLVGEKVLINQVGCFGINIGKIDFYLSNENMSRKTDSIKV